MIAFIYLLTLSKVLAGVEYLGFDLVLSWTFPDDLSVEFEYSMPLHYRQVFGWAGVAMQDARDAKNNFKGDYYIAFMTDGLMTDRYAERNGYSLTDVEQGGTYDLVASSYETEDRFVIVFKRLLETADIFDIKLTKDRPILIKYALGPVIDGYIEQHSMRFMGYEYIVLSQNYEDDNNDERFVYGPWLYPKTNS